MLPELVLASAALVVAFMHQHHRLSVAMRKRVARVRAVRIAGPIRGVLYRPQPGRDWTKARAYDAVGVDCRR